MAAGLVARSGLRRRALTPSGAWSGWLTGTVVTAAGWDCAAALFVFFLSGSVLSQLNGKGQEALAALWEKGSRRDAMQVLANGGVTTLAALVQAWRPGPLPLAACFGALAASSADTWATEVGVRSAAMPRRITDGRALAPGTSGGVTIVGLLGSLAGATVVAGIAAGSPRRDPGGSKVHTFLGITLAGVVAALFDSVLGATVQESRVCPVCRLATERRVHRCGSRTQLVRGYPWMNNDMVNVAATVLGATVALALSYASGQERRRGGAGRHH